MNTAKTSLEQPLQEVEILKKEIVFLNEQITWFKRQLFGQKSEKLVDAQNAEQLSFDGLEEPSSAEEKKRLVPAHHRSINKTKGKDKIVLPEDLPVEKQILDLPESEKVCPETGKPLVKIGEEITSKLAHKPGSYYIKQIVRSKYGLPEGEGVITPELPASLLDRCFADDSLLADIAVKKFADHLPIYRQAEIMSRQGIFISRQVLCQWMTRAGKALKPLYNEMLDRVLRSGNVFYDETPIAMLEPGRGKTRQAYMWVLVGGNSAAPSYRIYDFCNSRAHDNAVKLLNGYDKVLHSDKYGAYEALANKKQFTWCPCWAHIRRKFIEAEVGDLEFRNWVLMKIRHLFMLERVAWARSENERLQIRQEKEVPMIDALIAAIKGKLVDGNILPKSKFKTALGYFCGLIPYLKNYTLHAFARMDNNVAERAVRPLAIGRKNWLFVGNEDGGESAAVFYTLIQTCRALKINPRDYLEDVMMRLNDHPASKLHELLPDNWAEARTSSAQIAKEPAFQ